MADREQVKVLFVCSGNSCRSQMAEGFARSLRQAHLDAYSAGLNPKTISSPAVQVMQEVGINIANQKPTDLRDMGDENFDMVYTMCCGADTTVREVLPDRTPVVYVDIPSPAALAKDAGGSPDAVLHYHRVVRDKIKAWVCTL
mmetsp:Transcript_54896/g.134555  ORF Transcript_54896/g.134555 Transcript_54896/m.134555 type:complete len:143 (-) Transcript_54896:1214-1642(-)